MRRIFERIWGWHIEYERDFQCKTKGQFGISHHPAIQNNKKNPIINISLIKASKVIQFLVLIVMDVSGGKLHKHSMQPVCVTKRVSGPFSQLARFRFSSQSGSVYRPLRRWRHKLWFSIVDRRPFSKQKNGKKILAPCNYISFLSNCRKQKTDFILIMMKYIWD